MKTPHRQNLITYCALLIISVSGIFYGRAIIHDYSFLRVWELSNVLIVAIGIPFLFFQSKAGIPEFWSEEITTKTRFLIPAAIGIGFGLLDVLVIKVIMHPEPYQVLPPFLQPFPYSIFLFLSGGFEVEVFYRLIPMTIFLLIGNHFKEGKYYQTIFWVGAILTALREPLEQLPDGNIWFIVYSLLTGFLMNFLQAVYFKHAGFLSSLSVRLGHYLIWHILLGVYVEWFEL